MNVLYISFDSMTESLGKSQVLSYLNLLSNKNFKIFLISYEKNLHSNDVEINKNIIWYKLKYPQKFKIFTIFLNIIYGFYLVFKINSKHRINLIHSRSYTSSLISLLSFYFLNIPFIFDIRGFWIDEKIESGTWSSKKFAPLIFLFRFFEKILFKKSSEIVTLTYKSKSFIINKFKVIENKIHVIPTCVNYDKFYYDFNQRRIIRGLLNLPDDLFVLVYSGSIGGYYNFDYIINFFQELTKIKKAKLLILTKQNHNILINEIKNLDIRKDVIFKSVNYNEVYQYLSASDAGLIIYEKSISSIARCSTKLAEYWACDLPVFAPSDVGDLNKLFNINKQKNLLIKSFDRFSYSNQLKKYFSQKKDFQNNNDLRHYFSLDNGVEKYKLIYEKYRN